VGKRADQAGRYQARLQVHAGFILANAAFAAIFVALVLSAFHAPAPHDVPVGIVAPATVTGQVKVALGSSVPGGFELQVYRSEARARTGIAHREVDGALIASGGSLRLLVAQAGGTGPAQALIRAFDAMAARSGRTLTVADVAPPRADDSEAFSPFFVILGVLFPSLAAGSASALAFRRARPVWCVAAPMVVAAVIGAVTAGIADGVASLGNYAAIAGIVALFSLAVAAQTAALGRIWPPLVSVAVLVFMVLGIPVSGGPANLARFGPGFLRVLHPALPLGAAASAVRNAVYFDGYGTAAPGWVLAAWAMTGVAALILVATGRRQAPARLVPWPARAGGPGLHAAPGNGQLRGALQHAVPARGAQEADDSSTASSGLVARQSSPGPVWPGRAIPGAADHDPVLPEPVAPEPVAPEPGGPGPVRPESDLPGPAADPGPLSPISLVIGFDNSEPARRALSWTARLAGSRPGTLHIIYADHMIIDSDFSGFGHAEMTAARDQEAAGVAEAAAEIVAGASVPYTFERRPGAPAAAILSGASAQAASARDEDGPIIVVGRSGHAAHHVLGSVPVRLLHHSPYPVLTIP
jgi:nucleotide-binding universal stress UspA family protein